MIQLTKPILNDKADRNGTRFSMDALNEIVVNQKHPLPVTIDFDSNRVVGKTISFNKENDTVYCTIELLEKVTEPFLDYAHFAISGYVGGSHKEKDITVIDKLSPNGVALTLQPAAYL